MFPCNLDLNAFVGHVWKCNFPVGEFFTCINNNNNNNINNHNCSVWNFWKQLSATYQGKVKMLDMKHEFGFYVWLTPFQWGSSCLLRMKWVTIFLTSMLQSWVTNFINMFKRSFYTWRSQKCKKLIELTVFLVLLGSACIKAACKMLVKLTPELWIKPANS